MVEHSSVLRRNDSKQSKVGNRTVDNKPKVQKLPPPRPEPTVISLSGGGGGGCFPASARIVRRVPTGQEEVVVEMLAAGDEVLAWDDGPVWSRIAGWTYRNFERVVTHTELSYVGGRVQLAPVHFLPVRSSGIVASLKAGAVRPGDCIQVVTESSASWQVVTATNAVQARGQFDFVTLCGTAVVDCAVVSCYAKVPPALAHRLMAPLWQPVALDLPLLMTDQVNLTGCQSLWRVVNEWYTARTHDEMAVAEYCVQWDQHAAAGHQFTQQDTDDAMRLLSGNTQPRTP
jgi:hypothetical protein